MVFRCVKAARTTAALALLVGASALPAIAADKVSVGVVGTNSDAGVFIAEARGRFTEEGLDVTLLNFDGAARMIVPLGSGDLDVAGGAANAGVYNAAASGVAIKIVADRSRTEKSYNFQSLMVRKDLVESGKFKSYADLKGLKVAIPAPGGTPLSTLNEAAKKGGVRFADIEKVFLAFPQQVPAFANRAIDASIMVEPFATSVLRAGSAVRFASTEDFYPSDQIGMLFYSEKFARDRKDVALRFMKAYVRALRDYNDAVVAGKFAAGPKGDEAVAIMAKALKIPPAQVREAETQAIDPDGKLNVDSLKKDLAFLQEQGDVTDKSLRLEQMLDMSFVTEAVKQLGPYKPAR